MNLYIIFFFFCVFFVFFQAEDGIRYLVRSRGLGDVYKRQATSAGLCFAINAAAALANARKLSFLVTKSVSQLTSNKAPTCLLYTSDAADERSSVDLGGRRIIKKKKKQEKNRIQRLLFRTNTDDSDSEHKLNSRTDT